MQLSKLATVVMISSLLLSGCSLFERIVYRPDINQGNYITQQDIDKLQIGQSKEQVQFILGTPMLATLSSDNTWYYVFREQPQHQDVRQLTYILTFDNQAVLTDINTSTIGEVKLENRKQDETPSQ